LERIVFTVTNDLSYDQRMQRICTSLARSGYDILLIGRRTNNTIGLKQEIYKQKRLRCFFNRFFLFYAEYNMRLFFYLLFLKMDAICAIDLDTIMPCYFVSMLRGKKRVYDAHELFTEMKEVITRPVVKTIWMTIEKFAVPKFRFGYTVSDSIANEFKKRYAVSYYVIRNMPLKRNNEMKENAGAVSQQGKSEKIILYQGAVNEARGLENLVDAMQYVNAFLLVYGDGNIFKNLEKLIFEKKLQHKISLEEKVIPEILQTITSKAYAGINLVEPAGLNQVYSLANKFFDYIHAGIPQITMNFPEYKKINDEFEIAVLADTVEVKEITNAINLLLNNPVLYDKLKSNCSAASNALNWQQEEKQLITFYKKVFAS
jgi:glycosyltransferase involved in cell wall biosynthesis